MSAKLWAEIGMGIYETIYMTLASTLLGYVIGLPLGVVLIITRKGGIRENAALNQVLGVIVNILRSIPFLILMIAIIPFTRFVMGKSYGSTATIVPLTVAAFPFISRMVESSLSEVDGGVIEAAQAMGATPLQIIRKVYIPEATPSLISGAAIVATNILGYSAMAGSVGGGGLGAIAINYGYYRFNAQVMVVCIAIMVVLVQAVQLVGTRLSVKLDHRLR
ncbi:MAG: ABC transporter permease [Clostridiales bacterium]|nr:ABC transporter permease [Clostridiales bacterium]MDY2834320.1 methionine ABC transporter permease [Candidatus Aphodomonas sp.]